MYRVRGKQKVFKAPWRIRNVCYTLVSRQLERRFRWGRGGKVWSTFRFVVVFVLNQIHTRDLRLGFCPEDHWTVTRLDLPLDRPTDLPLTHSSRLRGIRPFQPIRDFTREDFENGPPMSTKQIRSITILREIPFVVPFNKRVSILQSLVAASKMRVQGNMQAFLQGPSVLITVRRSHLYEDAYDKLRPDNGRCHRCDFLYTIYD